MTCLRPRKKEKKMVAPYTQATQNNNKCPHGFPIGTCPICSGMGGAPKDRNTPRKAGEMSYNECLAEWRRMQRAENLKEQSKLNSLEAFKQYQEINNKIFNGINNIKEGFNDFKNSIVNMPKIFQLPMKILTGIIQPIVSLISKIPNAINTIQNFVTNSVQFFNSVAEKLSSFLGEIKNFIQEKVLILKGKKILKTLLSLFTETNQENEEENEEVQKAKLEEIKKVIKTIFKKKEKEEEKIKQ